MSKEKVSNYCIACGVVVSEDHIGIKCVQRHDICSKCSPHFVLNVFESPQSLIPVKCPQCVQEIPSLVFERQLTSEQLEIYQLYIIQQKISTDEKTQSCPHCKYFEVWLKESSANFFYCKNPKCSKLTCAICFRDVHLPRTEKHSNYSELEVLMMQELYLDDNEDQYEESLLAKEGIYHHFKCIELAELKSSIETILGKGAMRRCPTCKLAGRKDTACTHMTCPKCATKWCYFCGKDEKVLVDVQSGQTIYTHNEGWQYFPQACPMYFTEIEEFDDRWPLDEEECLDRFHGILTKKLVKEKIQSVGMEEFSKVLEQFPGIKNSLPEFEELETDDVKNPFIIKISREEFERMIE